MASGDKLFEFHAEHGIPLSTGYATYGTIGGTSNTVVSFLEFTTDADDGVMFKGSWPPWFTVSADVKLEYHCWTDGTDNTEEVDIEVQFATIDEGQSQAVSAITFDTVDKFAQVPDIDINEYEVWEHTVVNAKLDTPVSGAGFQLIFKRMSGTGDNETTNVNPDEFMLNKIVGYEV